MSSMIGDFFSDGGSFEKMANTWLSYEQIRQGNDASGSNQQAVMNTPSTTAQTQYDSALQGAPVVSGLSNELLIGGVVGVLGVMLLAKG
jgi:hypothetical protein